jgi:hypothetical protein
MVKYLSFHHSFSAWPGHIVTHLLLMVALSFSNLLWGDGHLGYIKQFGGKKSHALVVVQSYFLGLGIHDSSTCQAPAGGT